MKKTFGLHGIAKFALFATSYTPLFILIIIKQLYKNQQWLRYGDCDINAIKCLFAKFGLSIFFAAIIILGLIGCRRLFINLKQKIGNDVIVAEVTNRNNESIGYIATYIFPFVFQDFNTMFEIIAALFIFVVIYNIYVNSNMLLINPILNLFHYSIFEIKYNYKQSSKSGLVIIHDTEIEEESTLNISPIGFKLFYATKISSHYDN